MTTFRIHRSPDPIYLCAQQGPSMVNHLDPDETIITVHTSEMDAELATAISNAANEFSAAHSVRRPPARYAEPAGYQFSIILKPPDQIPDGKLVHLHLNTTTTPPLVTVTIANRINDELAARIASLGNRITSYYDLI